MSAHVVLLGLTEIPSKEGFRLIGFGHSDWESVSPIPVSLSPERLRAFAVFLNATLPARLCLLNPN
jgi:hypothetical protein